MPEDTGLTPASYSADTPQSEPERFSRDDGQVADQRSVLNAEDALRLMIQEGEAPASYPLWSHLSPAARLEFERQLARLDPATLQYFSLLDLALLVQWLFAQHDIETVDIARRAGGLDLTLFNPRQSREEYAAIYEDVVPPDLFQELSETLEGREITRVRLCTLGAFSEAQWKVQREFPSFLEFWDHQALARYLREAQLVYKSPRIQSRRALPAPKSRPPSAGRRSRAARKPGADPARLKTQFVALTKAGYLSEQLLMAGVAVTGLAFALSLLNPTQATILWGVAVIATVLLRLYTGYRRRGRSRQLWSLLNSSSEAFEIGMPYVFRMLGYHVERVRRYHGHLDADRTGSRGIVIRLRRRRRHSVAYCASPPLVLTAMDVGVCEAEMEKQGAEHGMVVVRGAFSLAATHRAVLDRITLVDGLALRAWLK